ncbi:MAG TPA: Gfo/Idh/MocA family oxidoreductase, partial [Vicinamibacteria bacterium]|nr:Gfo/Idh/MocA family oxidoreductase [Vicinamibacteria bacterium]
MAIVGINGQGKSHLQCFAALPGVRIKTICDVDERTWPEAARFAERFGVGKVGFEADFRRVLDDREIDAVSIATPNHQHALQAIWACQAGKDVYVEKPVSHDVFEGRQAVKAARRFGRVVVGGMQQRSYPHVVRAVELLRSGAIGELRRLEMTCPNMFDWGTHWFDMMFFYNDETPAEWALGQIEPHGGPTVFG